MRPMYDSGMGKNNGSHNLVCENNYALPTFFTAAGAEGATLGLVVPGRLLSETTQTSMKTSTVNPEIFERFLFSRLGYDLLISVNDRMNPPFREDFIFKNFTCKVLRK